MDRHRNLLVDAEHGIMAAVMTKAAQAQVTSDWPVLDRVVYPGEGTVITMPWTDEACRLLYNIGLTEALECTQFMYDTRRPLVEGKFTPLRHQALTASFMTLFSQCYVLSEPRTGKTGSTILACEYLQRQRRIEGGVCIITTYTTIKSVWEAAIKSTLPDAVVQVVHGSTRREALEQPADFYITNYDSVRLDFTAFRDAMDEGRIGAIVVDELTHVGNTSTQRSKSITRLCRHPHAQFVCGLTGSPADNPEAVFGMGKCINPGALPCSTKGGWQSLIYNWWGSQTWQHTLKADASQTIFRALSPAIRFAKSDVLDLPPVTEQIRSAELSKEQQKLLTELRRDAITMLESGETITAANGGVLLQRLLQIALGCIRDDAGNPLIIPHKERTQVMLEAIAETPRKTVIFSPYVAGCHMLADECRAAGYTAEVITGEVGGNKRAEILRAFQYEKDPHILVCHPITVGFGTELSAADTMIFAVPLMLGGFVYNQALERLSSVKQKAENINIIHILSGYEERKVLNNLRLGHMNGKAVAALFEDILKGDTHETN